MKRGDESSNEFLWRSATWLAVGFAVAMTAVGPGCGDDEDPDDPGGEPTDRFSAVSCDDFPDPCLEIEASDVEGLLTAVNTLAADSTVVLGAGRFELNSTLALPTVSGTTLIGQGIDVTILDYSGQSGPPPEGIEVTADNFRIEGMTLSDSNGDALVVRDSDGVIIRAVKATWSNLADTDNGAYGLYPVNSQNVLMEDCEAYNASDAGIYIGQSENVIVRNNIAEGNVAGLEIENTQFVDVHDNRVENNTGGLVVFDLPGNPIVGRDVRIYDNVIANNNGVNFATEGTTVAQIPPGTGTFVLASRRVEIFDNTYEGNDSANIAILSGLALELDDQEWRIPKAMAVGDFTGLDLIEDEENYFNFRTKEILIRDNTFVDGGTDPQGNLLSQPIGFLVAAVFGDTAVDSVIYDSIGESGFSATEAGENTNDNRICVTGNTGATFASLDLGVLQARLEMADLPLVSDLYRPEAPFAPFDCTSFSGGPISEVTLP
ncbi:MAG: parallel beta-helix domain-containing protein [Myxococcota bacterium]